MLSVLEMARRLVAIESVSDMSNRPIVEVISQLCEDAGCDIIHHPYNDGQQVNIIATKGGSDPYCALSGHTDTVGYNAKKWLSEKPLELTPVTCAGNTFFCGLGIADMKLALATFIAATDSISSRELKRPLGLYFTAQEEIGCIGAKRLVALGVPLAPYIVVGEPTEMAVANRHKGYVYFSVTVTRDHDKHDLMAGLYTHSSNDRGCTNVVETILPIALESLVTIKDHLRTIPDPSFDPPYTTMNVGMVELPNNASKNIIPTSFTLHCDARPIPSMDPDMLLRLVERQIMDAVDRYQPLTVSETFSTKVRLRRQPTPFLWAKVDESFDTAMENPTIRDVPYNTEAQLYVNAGSQALILGPGSIKEAHHENEFVSERWLQPDVTERYTAIIRAMCG